MRLRTANKHRARIERQRRRFRPQVFSFVIGDTVLTVGMLFSRESPKEGG